MEGGMDQRHLSQKSSLHHSFSQRSRLLAGYQCTGRALVNRIRSSEQLPLYICIVAAASLLFKLMDCVLCHFVSSLYISYLWKAFNPLISLHSRLVSSSSPRLPALIYSFLSLTSAYCAMIGALNHERLVPYYWATQLVALSYVSSPKKFYFTLPIYVLRLLYCTVLKWWSELFCLFYLSFVCCWFNHSWTASLCCCRLTTLLHHHHHSHSTTASIIMKMIMDLSLSSSSSSSCVSCDVLRGAMCQSVQFLSKSKPPCRPLFSIHLHNQQQFFLTTRDVW